MRAITVLLLLTGICVFANPAAAQDVAQAQAELNRAMAAHDLPAMARALDTIIAQNRATMGPDSPATLVPLETRATVAQMMGDMKLSEQLYREALAGRARVGAPEDEQIALDVNNLAQAIEAQGRYADAEPFYRKALEVREKTATPNARELALSVNNLANNLSSSAKLPEAEALFRRALAINIAREGPEGETVAGSIANLGAILAARGDYQAAEDQQRKALAIRIKRFGPTSAEVGSSYNAIGYALASQGRYAEAETELRRALDIRRAAAGEVSPGVAETMGNLASVLQAQGQAEAAEPLFREVIETWRGLVGPDHPLTLGAESNLATDLSDQARLGEATPILRRVLEARRRVLGPTHPETATAAINLASVLEQAGDPLAAETLLREALAIDRTSLGERHERVATVTNNLAENLMQQGRFEEAEALHRTALDIRIAALGEDHPDVGDSYNNLAGALSAQRRYADATPLLEKALAIYGARYGKDSLMAARALNNLAGNRDDLGQSAAATPLYQRVLAIRRQRLGEAHPLTANSINNLGFNLYQLGRKREAVPLYEEALGIYQRTRGAESPDVLVPENNLAMTLADLGGADARALAIARESTRRIQARRQAIIAGVAAGGDLAAQAALRARADTLLDADPGVTAFITLTQVDWVVAQRDAAQREALKGEAFSAAQQISVSQAGQAMARTAARVAAGSGPLGRLVARQQEGAARIATLETRYSAAVARGDAATAAATSAEIAAQAQALAAFDTEIKRGFPNYGNLIAPGVLDLAAVRARLQPDEGLLFIQPSNGDLFSFAVSAQGFAWSRAGKRQLPMKADVELLLCQMDEVSCTSPARAALPKETPLEAQGHRAFARATAYGLYRDLIAPVEGGLAGVKRLYVTTPGSLGRLPLEVLVTAPPAAGDDADPALLAATPWLGERYAITVLPSVGTLRALEQAGKARSAGTPFRGYGAPHLAGAGSPVRGMPAGLFRSGAGGEPMADPGMLRQLPSLPGTRMELTAMAAALKAPTEAVRLDTAATEGAVRADKSLGEARVVAFATHGLLPDEIRGLSEPGLVFTPPSAPSPLDDGVLTASEAATLTLSADWVILSACNTATADSSADSLSSLSRAFLYAGARALLASHWRVSDEVTAVLTVETQREDVTQTRAVALQSAMRAVRTGKRGDGSAVSGWTPDWAHPMMWAPFSLISTADE
jgi:CHAT domain-containing protein/tetratricopeptide (TPR) repeat protein